MTEKSGAWDKLKGKANEAIGDVRGDEAQRKRGEAQQAKGEYEQKRDQANEEESRSNP